jgi:CRISPR/Cas system-associated exonuclease Cas4 (RecB family)
MVKKLLTSTSIKKSEDSEIDLNIIIDKINEGYLSDRGPRFITKKTFAPSTLVYNHGICPRYWYLAFEGGTFEDEVTPKQVANMENGSKSHDRIQEAIKKTGVPTKRIELKITHNDPPIFGYGDGLLKIKDNDVLLEIKTVDDIGFERIKQANKPRSYHALQALLYMKILNVSIGAILYENKNTHDMMVFPLTVTKAYKDYINYMFDWMKEVYKAWEDKEMPKRPFRGKTKVCQNCPLVTTCYDLPDGTLNIKRRKEFEL